VAIPDAGQGTLPLVVSTLVSVELDLVLYLEITYPDPSQLTLTNPLNSKVDISPFIVVWDLVPTTGLNLVMHKVVVGFSGHETANGKPALLAEGHMWGETGTVDVLWMEVISRWD
jgi:hypothetical protein